MPALSPTMTEGNVASWKVKEGDSFTAGDVLLEIETDKASMDVEAQDDGIMAKIVVADGAKGVKVGTRIGVIAEEGDDLATLEIPEDNGPAPSPKEETAKVDSANSSSSQGRDSQATGGKAPVPKKSSKAEKQTYPLFPSVEHILHENGLSEADVEKMSPSGPKGRLLKGDVLAYLGAIKDSYPAELSSKIDKLSHLDLSNIKIAPQKPAPKPAAAEVPVPEVKNTEVAVPVSMAAVLEVQKRIEATLGTFLPLSTFIARAADLANDGLPRSKAMKPTADELFNAVLGLDKVSSANGVRGNYTPQITALPETAVATIPRPAVNKSKADIIDILSGKTRSASNGVGRPILGVAATTNIFSVTVPKGDERRAQIFLERVKTVLEGEPGRLIL